MSASDPCCLGVDPGASGATAFYWPAQLDALLVEDTPVADGMVDAATLAARIREAGPTFAFVERVGAMPGQGVSSTFKFGVAYGTVLGVLASLAVPIHLVAPGKWKRAMGLSADKEEARALALRLWPGSSFRFARKRDHGRAEAALIARYGAAAMNIHTSSAAPAGAQEPEAQETECASGSSNPSPRASGVPA